MSNKKRSSFIVRRFVRIPRRSRCLVIILLVVFFQLCSLLIYSITSSADNEHLILSQLDNFDFAKARTFVNSWFKKNQAGFDARLAKLMKSIPLTDKKYWTFQNELTDILIEIPLEQLKVEQKSLSFDPRFTYSVYLNYIKSQFELKNPNNEPTLLDDSKKVYVPFQWSDWVDLSMLNQYIALPELEKPNCDFLYPPKTRNAKQNPNRRTGSRRNRGNANLKAEVVKDISEYCVVNSKLDKEYLAANNLKDTSLLPGFNVIDSGPKGAVEKKRLQAKSFLYSTFENPSSILFMVDDGIYEVFTKEKQKIRSSDLLSTYIKDHGYTDSAQNVVFNPVKELNDLSKVIPAQNFAGKQTFDDLILLDDKLRLHLNDSLFIYDPESIVQNYEEIMSTPNKLTSKQKAHYDSLKYSTSIPPLKLTKHFKEAAIVAGSSKKESGTHYDWRFYNGFVSLSAINDKDDVTEKKRIILHRLLKNWLQFTYKTNIITWIAHGSLLSWYWDGISFPWDVDIDVQMPMIELDRFALMFNNSLIVENLNEGFAKFYIDCSSNMSHRTKGNGHNNIDARFIDVDSGFYIDITGLTLTNTKVSKRYEERINTKKVDAIVAEMKAGAVGWENKGRKAREEAEKSVSIRYLENQALQAYNCRNNHFYLLEELSPLRISLIEGTKTFIPNNYKDILKLEYTRGLTVTTYNKHVYIPQLRLWLPFEKVYEILKEEVEAINSKTSKRPSRNKRITATKIMKLMREIDEEMLFKLLQDDYVLKEYYLTSEITKLHEQEMEKINSNTMTREFMINNIINNKFKPLRKDMFIYTEQVKHYGESKGLKMPKVTTNDRKETIREKFAASE